MPRSRNWKPVVHALAFPFAVVLLFPPIAGGSRRQTNRSCSQTQQSATRSTPGVSVGTSSGDNHFRLRRIYVGTNRLPVESPDGKTTFGSQHGPLRFAKCEVTVGDSGRRGELRGISICSINLLKSAEELPTAKSRNSGVRNQNVLVFVHGFYVAFEESIRRATQIARELNFHGTVYVFTWPSVFEMTPSGYARDQAAVERSADSFRVFLSTLGRRYGSRNVKVLAHSLGCRLVAKAARRMASKPNPSRELHCRYSNIILAAPDIPMTDFRTMDRKALSGIATRVTVYCSTKDRFLRYAGGLDAAGSRLGQTAAPHGQTTPIEFVDYSQLPGGLWNLCIHNRYREDPRLLKDIRGVLENTVPPSSRRLNQIVESDFGTPGFLQ